jgi:hypothetical protein
MYGMKVSIQATSLTDADVAGWGDVTQIAKVHLWKKYSTTKPGFPPHNHVVFVFIQLA